MAEKKLSKANLTTLEELQKNPNMTPELLELFKSTILEVKESTESRERKPRSLSLNFTPDAAKIFRLRVFEGKAQGEVEDELEIDAPKVNQGVREVGYKIIAQLLKNEAESEDKPVTNMIDKILTENATGKGRQKKDEVVGGENAANTPGEDSEGDTNQADEIEGSELDESALEDILNAD